MNYDQLLFLLLYFCNVNIDILLLYYSIKESGEGHGPSAVRTVHVDRRINFTAVQTEERLP